MSLINADTCLVDMDGVLVDFAKGLAEVIGQPWPRKDITKQTSIFDLFDISSEKILYDIIFRWERDTRKSFWTSLRSYPETRELLMLLRRCFKKIIICSKPNPYNPTNAGKKMLWCQRELAGEYQGIIITNCKDLIPLPLIDDIETSAVFTIRYPQPWNENWEITDPRDKYEYVKGILRIQGFNI